MELDLISDRIEQRHIQFAAYTFAMIMPFFVQLDRPYVFSISIDFITLVAQGLDVVKPALPIISYFYSELFHGILFIYLTIQPNRRIYPAVRLLLKRITGLLPRCFRKHYRISHLKCHRFLLPHLRYFEGLNFLQFLIC